MNYIQAGVISPDEVRSVLREDVNSGYNTLSEEIEGSSTEDPFGDIFGGGENSQSLFDAAMDDNAWITTEKGVHIPLEDNQTKEEACNNFFKEKENTVQKVKNAINDIVEGKSNEILIKNIRNDLEQYGGTNDIVFLKGNTDGGIEHLNTKHKDDIEGVVNALVNGDVVQYVPNRKVLIIKDGYKALLSLDYFGEKKTWLLTGYKVEE